MTREEETWVAEYENQFCRIPPPLVKLATETLKNNLPGLVKQQIAALREKKGHLLWSANPEAQIIPGVMVRQTLRLAVIDAELPEQSWDYYWAGMVELALDREILEAPPKGAVEGTA